ncbi:MAG: HAD family hydrolase [Symploca sp. SIO3C6]|uniref:HAD family hydrolase n=1 Tax=Symploca sp. SIO1C4 TaxID=2607765 RepID=A0A6B3N6P6_9CYAN|nr:HAD family hydrolase [Symploca sp. SIO3C6]NER27280.1 HAD family hydrolase [Symploca sp. SIO1C4]NET05479.1 HAD family hydrolase [Symploca sp. SIO2B6]
MATIECRNRTFLNIEAVIFDKDGTLEDSQVWLRELGYKRVRILDAQIPGIGEPLLMAFGIQEDSLDPAGLMAVGSRRENMIAAAAYIAETGRGWLESLVIAKNAFEEAEQYFKTETGTSPLFAGSLEVLKFLSEAGLKLGILSADSTTGVQAFVKRHQLEPYIQLQQGVDTDISKPDPALFLQACQTLGVQPHSTLMVGDSVGDMEMGHQAGAAGCIGISWGNLEAAANLEGADVAISQLDEIQVLDS